MKRPTRRGRARGWVACAVLGTVSCGGGESAPAHTPGAPREVTLAELFTTPADTLWDLDTPAVWVGDGSARVLVTAKGTHELRVFDAATGAAVGVIGAEGPTLGAFQRPNAVLVSGDLAFVVERDNHRVQVLGLPGGAPLGAFGDEVLERPYGAVISGTLPELVFWVTDDYEVPGDAGGDLSRRIHRFRVRFDARGTPLVLDHATFGDAAGPGALAVVETIGLDAERNRLLVADEERRAHLVYDTAGAFTGEMMAEGRIAGDPEGVALVRCADGAGYWIATDQQADVSWFRLFRRADLTYVGSFRGARTTNTDGVTFAGEVPGLSGPVFFAVHDDQAVSAFSWDAVAEALGLAPGCGR